VDGGVVADVAVDLGELIFGTSKADLESFDADRRGCVAAD